MKKLLFIIPALLLLALLTLVSWYLLFGRSYASINLDGRVLSASFVISQLDKESVHQLSQSLALGSQWTQGVKVTLDESSAKKLAGLTPKKVYLTFSKRGVSFKTQSLPSLANPAMETKDSLSWETEDLVGALNEATSSGDYQISAKIKDDLWNLASKIAKIKLTVNKEMLEGEVILK